MEIEDIHIERYNPQAGDVLIVRFEESGLTEQEADRVRLVVKRECGTDVGCIVLGPNARIDILRREAVEVEA